MTKKALLFLAFSVAGFAQYDRPVRYWTTDPTGACNVITPLWNNWVAGKVWQCVGPTTTPGAGSWQLIGGGGGSSAFSALTTGSNTTAVMTVGSGANLTFTGTGIINASKILGTTITGLTGPIKFTSGIPSVAVATDIIGLFSACSGSQYLGADGSCHNAAGAGTVTSVALTAPAWLTVGGSPVTTAGTLALTATTGQTSHQVIGTCGAGTTFAPCALVLGDFPAIANNTVLGNTSGISAVPSAVGQVSLTALINPFSSSLSGAAPASGGGTTNFLRADGSWAAPSGGGTGNAAQLHTVTFGATPAFACTSGSAGTVETFELSTTLTANITPTISGCTSGQMVSFRFKQDATGSRTVTWPAAWNTLAQPSPLANIETTIVAVWDGTSGKGSASSDGQGTCPEQAAPGVSPPAGSEFPWCDSTGLFPRWRNSSGTIFQAAKELTAGNIRKAGGANTVDAAAAASDVVAIFSTCSGTQYLGADGACHNTSTTVNGTTCTLGASCSPTASPTNGHVVAAVLTCPTSSASGTAEVCNTSPTFTPAAGDSIIFQADIANTGAFTLNVNSLGVKSVKKNGTAALIANDILASPFQVVMTYDGTNWEMQGQAGNAAASGTNNLCTDQPAAGAWAPTITAGHTYCLSNGTYTVSTSPIAINAANVTVVCTAGTSLVRATAAVNLFTVTAAHFNLVGCPSDGNSVNGGSLVELDSGSDYAVIERNTFTNAGTNSAKGIIHVAGGTHVLIRDNNGLSVTDTFILVDGSSADATYGDILNNYVTGTAPAIKISPPTNGGHHWNVDGNKVLSSGNSCFIVGGSVSQLTGNHYVNNWCTAAGTMTSAGYQMNGLHDAIFGNNTYDGAGQNNSGGMSLSDCGTGTIVGNHVYNAWLFSIQELDASTTGPCTTTGNAVEVAQASTVGETDYGIHISEVGLGNPGNIVSDNTVTWISGVNYQGATTAIQFDSTTAHATGGCSATGNNVYDAGAALAASATLVGIRMGGSTGTTNNCSISGGNVSMPAVGSGTSSTAISIGSAATGTLVGQPNLVLGTGATYFTDSGVNTHMVPQCHDYNLTASSTNWLVTIDGSGTATTAQSAATTQNVVLFALCPHCLITAIDIKTSTAFIATGLTSMTTTVGDSTGGTTFYTSSTYDLHAAVSNTNFQDSVLAKRATQAGSNVTAALTANQNFTANTITGSADYRVCWVAP